MRCRCTALTGKITLPVPVGRDWCILTSLINTSEQGVNETIHAYVTELQLQAKNCEFGSLCNELIRDRIVVGISDDSVMSRLLREPDLDLQKAVDICRAAEQIRSHMDALKNATIPIDAVRKGPKGKTDKNDEKARKPEEKFGQKFLCKYCGMSNVRDKQKCPALGEMW